VPRVRASTHRAERNSRRFAGLRTVLGALATGAAFFLAGRAAATECEPDNGLSPCINSNSLWLATGDSYFASISSGSVPDAGQFVVGLGGQYFSQPLTLIAHSPDPDGRKIPVVDDVVDLSLLASMSIRQRWELSLALPVAIYQNGTGIEPATSQDSVPASHTALRDPRIGTAFELFRDDSDLRFATKSRLELSLPVGAEHVFAGERGLVIAPSFVFSLEHGSFYASSELGMRLRQSVEFSGARHGSQLVAAVGLGAHLFWGISLGAEVWMLPVVNSQERTLPDGTKVEDAVLVPAEWLTSVRVQPQAFGGLSLLLGAGTALPLSSERRQPPDGPVESDHFAGLTAPRFRALLLVRYARLSVEARKAETAAR
jgi:hypothetical protein